MQVVCPEHFGMLSQFLPVLNREVSQLPPLADETGRGTYRVLIIERSISLAKLLQTGLAAEAVAVDVAHDMNMGERFLDKREYNLVLVDLDSSEAGNASPLETLRVGRPSLRVLAMSGRTEIGALVEALDAGADDYLLKPFSLLELIARVRALRRRAEMVPQSASKPSKLVLYRDQCRVERDGHNIELTPREFSLLEVLVQNAGKTMSRALLTQEVWNMPSEANTNIVDVYIKYLRDKIDGSHDEKLIRTVRGTGYFIQL